MIIWLWNLLKEPNEIFPMLSGGTVPAIRNVYRGWLIALRPSSFVQMDQFCISTFLCIFIFNTTPKKDLIRSGRILFWKASAQVHFLLAKSSYFICTKSKFHIFQTESCSETNSHSSFVHKQSHCHSFLPCLLRLREHLWTVWTFLPVLQCLVYKC